MKTQTKKMTSAAINGLVTQTSPNSTAVKLKLVPKTKTELVQSHGESIWTTSLLISDRFGKRHDNVLRAILNLECSDEFSRLNFEERDYTDERGKVQPMYRITKDGFAWLAMGFTGKEAAIWKEKFIAAFRKMEQELKRIARLHASVAYQQARIGGKTDRRDLTDAVQALAHRAHQRGDSTSQVDVFMMSATKAVVHALFVIEQGEKVKGIRDRLTAKQLNRLAMAEDVYADAVEGRLDSNMNHHDIYVEAKAAVIAFAIATGNKSFPGVDRRNAVNGEMMLESA